MKFGIRKPGFGVVATAAALLLLAVAGSVTHVRASPVSYTRGGGLAADLGVADGRFMEATTTAESIEGAQTHDDEHGGSGSDHSSGEMHVASDTSAAGAEAHSSGEEHHESHPHVAILYPCFVLIVGVVVHFLLSRYCHFLPYTAIMFLIGVFMGIGIVGLGLQDQLSQSTRMWENINSHLLLQVFLPGLLFRDAYSLNVHLFAKSIGQCLTMAFPMVLAGTCLLALVGFYILPYGWSFTLCMTFGAILSATDPVAVSALLNEVGAPPRLKTHICGESLLNDGSAIVFFFIFGSQFLFDLGIPGLGQDVDLATGVALFFKMSLGAAAIGAAFGFALTGILYVLHRRFNHEENVVQVMATVAIAYLSFYVAEPVCMTSGVIAVVTCGIITKAFAASMVNDPVTMDRFWGLLEHLLNTVLFALGGVVWGTVISNMDPTRTYAFNAADWGYLFLLYVLMMAIRTFLVVMFYPLISRIGLGSSWQEGVFISFGGLRGAVGIALAISLDNELYAATEDGDPSRDYTSQLFGMTGGIAFLTLFINGTLAGPLLKKLGLADVSEMRHMITDQYHDSITLNTLQYLLHLIGEKRFYKVDFALVCTHVPFLQNLSTEQLKIGVKRNRGAQPPHEYREPNLNTFVNKLDSTDAKDLVALSKVSASERLKSLVRVSSISVMPDTKFTEEDVSKEELVEARKTFVELLRNAYEAQIGEGQVDVRAGFLVFVLNASLEITEDSVAKGGHLNDWEVCQKLSDPKISRPFCTKKEAPQQAETNEASSQGRPTSIVSVPSKGKEFKKTMADVHRAAAFIEAHKRAQISFKAEFCSTRMLSSAERLVLDESNLQIQAAEDLIQSKRAVDVELIMSHLLCSILLNNAAMSIGKYVEKGLLRETEAEHEIEKIEHQISLMRKCDGKKCKSGTDYARVSTAMITSSSYVSLSSIAENNKEEAVEMPLAVASGAAPEAALETAPETVPVQRVNSTSLLSGLITDEENDVGLDMDL